MNNIMSIKLSELINQLAAGETVVIEKFSSNSPKSNGAIMLEIFIEDGQFKKNTRSHPLHEVTQQTISDSEALTYLGWLIS